MGNEMNEEHKRNVSSKVFDLFDLLKLALPIVIGVFIATGFIISTAFQHFFGLQITLQYESLILQSGKFIWEGMLALIDFVGDISEWDVWEWLSIVFMILIIFLLPSLFRMGPSVILRGLILVVFILLSITEILWFASPLFEFENFLIEPLQIDKSFKNPRADYFYKAILCSRIDPLPDDKSECQSTSQTYEDQLRNSFLQTGFLAILVLISGTLFIWNFGCEPKFQRGNRISLYVASSLICLIVVISLLEVPYVFAKIRQSTIFKEVIVHYLLEQSEMDDSLLGGYFESKAIPNGNENKPVLAVHGWILAETQNDITLLEKRRHLLWVLPKTSVKLIIVETINDVLKERINYYENFPDRQLEPVVAPGF